jgi:AraC-like DNA-binding protein
MTFVRSAQPEIGKHLSAHARMLVYAERSRIDQTWATKGEALLHRDPNAFRIDYSARHLAIGARTLQRRLADEGTNFELICDNFRQARLYELLVDAKLTLGELAEGLGYVDVRSLQRAYRRWNGDGTLAQTRARLRQKKS